jgi:hypothetical protein
VVGPLAAFSEPHSYDLCEAHARGLTAPRGWDLVRHEGEFEAQPPNVDDLVALAEAVREAARPNRPNGEPDAGPAEGRGGRGTSRTTGGGRTTAGGSVGRRGHLRVIPPQR